MKRNTLAFGTKINCTFAALAAVLALTVWFGFYTEGSLSDSLENVTGKTLRKIQLAGTLNTAECRHGGRHEKHHPVHLCQGSSPDRAVPSTLPGEFGVVPKGAWPKSCLFSLPKKENKLVANMEANALRSWLPGYCGSASSKSMQATRMGPLKVLAEKTKPYYVALGEDAPKLVALAITSSWRQSGSRRAIRSPPAGGSCSCW